MFRCPACKTSFDADLTALPEMCGCGFAIRQIEGIPLLVKDRVVIDSNIRDAEIAGRGKWYTGPQMGQWTGPYRHHLLKRKQYVSKILGAYSKQRPRIGAALDLGCGDGVNSSWLIEHFDTLYASDYNLSRLLRAAGLPRPPKLFLADITDYPAPDAAFDVVFFNHVLEHIPDDRRALAEVYRILKPGGLLILGVPNEGALFWRLAYALQPGSRDTSDHVHFYTAKSLASMSREAGFVVQDIHPIGWGLPHWTLDAMVRGSKWVDDLFEKVGRVLLPSQASSLYLVLSK